MKIIRVTTDNKVTAHDYPEGDFSRQNTALSELIGNGCELVERVHPKRLYEKLKFSCQPTMNEGESVSMLVDEEGLLKDDVIVNPIGSFLYETDKHGYIIAGNILFVGEQIAGDGISYCGLSDINFNRLKTCLEQMASILNEEVQICLELR
ncbi:MAG: hypothetical protein Q4D26_10550 [Clostridia bacterium]|nr:hypothetical protein [Clostridia bacterium]